MSEQDKIQLFDNQPIRTTWSEENEERYGNADRNAQKLRRLLTLVP